MPGFAVAGEQQPAAETTRSPQSPQQVSPGDRSPQPGRRTAGAARPALRPSQVPAGTVVRGVLRGAGTPLDEPVRQDMEARLGADFRDVRVHRDAAAQRSAAETGARAYTSGSHVVLGAGGADRRTLAHELKHVIQQRQGAVPGTDHGDGLRLSDPSDSCEREAEATAARVTAPGFVPGAALAHRQAGTAQRPAAAAPAPDGLAVQRAIGTVGAAAIGRLVRKSPAMMPFFTVMAVRQGANGAWEYQLKHKLLGEVLWVTEDDAAYDLAKDVKATPAELAVRAVLTPLITAPPRGNINNLLLGPGGAPAKVAPGVEMKGEKESGADARVLWSGGAADCVIVAAVSNGSAWITHADRIGPSPRGIAETVEKFGGGAQVFLASQIFASSNPEWNELVRDIVQALLAKNIAITAIFKTASLALNADTGAVLAGLTPQDVEVLRSAVKPDAAEKPNDNNAVASAVPPDDE